MRLLLLLAAGGADLEFLKTVSTLDERQLRRALGLLVRLNLVD